MHLNWNFKIGGNHCQLIVDDGWVLLITVQRQFSAKPLQCTINISDRPMQGRRMYLLGDYQAKEQLLALNQHSFTSPVARWYKIESM